MRIKKRSRWRGMKEDVVNTGTHEPADQHHQGDARANRNRPSSIERLHWGVMLCHKSVTCQSQSP